MKKTIRLTESDLTFLIKKVIKEVDETVAATEKVMNLSSELGTGIDSQTANDVMACSSEEIQPPAGTDPKATTIFQQVKQKISEMVAKKDREGLKNAFKQLKQKLREANKNPKNQQNEQVELVAAFTILGISAPLWIWVAIGAVVLFLLIKGIVNLSSWIPRKKGRGCSRTIRYRVS